MIEVKTPFRSPRILGILSRLGMGYSYLGWTTGGMAGMTRCDWLLLCAAVHVHTCPSAITLPDPWPLRCHAVRPINLPGWVVCHVLTGRSLLTLHLASAVRALPVTLPSPHTYPLSLITPNKPAVTTSSNVFICSQLEAIYSPKDITFFKSVGVVRALAWGLAYVRHWALVLMWEIWDRICPKAVGIALIWLAEFLQHLGLMCH